MLKYLFHATFNDGSIVAQNQEDASSLDPVRSQFYDVLNHPAGQPVIFTLADQKNVFTLDLKTGIFTLNGIGVYGYSQDKQIDLNPLRIIYFRMTQASMTITGAEHIVHDPVVQYHFGWQTTLESGENVKQVMVVE